MRLTSGWTEYQSSGGTVPAYGARPAMATPPLPGVLVIQEAWGVNDHICDIVERFATAGYAAVAADPYAIGQPRPEARLPAQVEAAQPFLNATAPGAWADLDARQRAFDVLGEPQRSEIAESMAAVFSQGPRMDPFLAALQSAVTFLRTSPATACPTVGSIGFCLGGGLSARLACATPGPAC